MLISNFMNNRSRQFSNALYSLAILYLLTIRSASGDPPRLGLTFLAPNRTVELSLTGEVGSAYTIETSLNLSNWSVLSSGVATNGLLTLRYPVASDSTAIFYRGRAATVSPGLTVSLAPDTNLTLSTLVSPAGGAAVLYGHDGTQFTFRLSSNSIPEARIITMTLVTNINALPFARGTIGAVLIEPADFGLWGAAELEIILPPGTDRREIVSFYARGNGDGFQLTVDRVLSDRVLIPITRGGVFGSSRATAEELAAAAKIEVGSEPPQIVAAGKLSAYTRLDCAVAKRLAAEARERQINQALSQISRELAAKIGAERQLQLLGAADDSPSALQDLNEEICAFYMTHVAPHWPEALQNCALARILTRFALGLERQRQLMGGADGSCPELSDLPLCPYMKNCLEEIRECCESGVKGPGKVAEVLSLMRQQALMGDNCISQDEAQEVMDLCSSNAWTGTFLGSVHGKTNSTTAGDYTQVNIEEYDVDFQGIVWEATESDMPGGGLSVMLRVIGQLTVRDFTWDTTSGVFPCREGGGSSGLYHLRSSERVGAGQTEYLISFMIGPDGSYSIFAVNPQTVPEMQVPATHTNIRFEQSTTCSGPGRTVSESKTIKSFAYGAYMQVLNQMTSDTNVVKGMNVYDDPDKKPATHTEFHWDFKRHVVKP